MSDTVYDDSRIEIDRPTMAQRAILEHQDECTNNPMCTGPNEHLERMLNVSQEGPESSSKQPTQRDWYALAERFVDALEVVTMVYAEQHAQSPQESHECRPRFIGQQQCETCGRSFVAGTDY